jgi:SagB-type dehydrogenase family enzyme
MKNAGIEFLQLTKPHKITPAGQYNGVPQPPLELPYDESAPLIPLPEVEKVNIPAMDLRQAIRQRKSLRHYDPQPLSLDELSFLLWSTQGIKSTIENKATIRTVPSAGARHAFETYLLINRVDGLQPGLYRYIAFKHALLLVNAGAEICKTMQTACFDQAHVGESNVTFFWVAVTERMTWRYSERGYRYLLLDAGHVCQNLYMAAEAINCGVCAIAAYDDDPVNAALGADGESLWCAYVATLGKKKAKE